MQIETNNQLRKIQDSLQKMDGSLAMMMQNPAIKVWNNIGIPENEALIFFFGVRSNPTLHAQVGDKKLPGLIDAQIAFRLHPTRKSQDDIYQTINDIRRTINDIATALAMTDDSAATLAKIQKETETLQGRTKYFQQAGKILQTVYLNLKRFTLLDMVGYIRHHVDAGSAVEKEFMQNGIRLFTFLEDKSSDPGGQQLLPISTCMEKADSLLFTFTQYPNTCEELASSTSHLVPAVIVDLFIAPVAQVLQKIRSDLQSREGMLDKLTTPIKDEFGKLNRADNPAAFFEYFNEIEKIVNRVKIALIDLGRNKDFLTIIDVSNTIISEATAFSGWLRNIPDDLEEEFRRPNATVDMGRYADNLRRRYYTGGLISMVKRFFSRKLGTDLIIHVLKNCPVLPSIGGKGNIKEMKDTNTLNNFLRKTLRQYEDTMVYKDIDQTLRQGILEYAKLVAARVGAVPLNSPSLREYYDGAALLQHLTSPTRLGKKK